MSENADKRSVATDAVATIGTIIDETAGRDAIHMAVEPVIAGARLWAGCPVRIVDGKAYRANREDASGIVDPFLDKIDVQEGQRFWLVLYPRTITSLRHVWSHPDFPENRADLIPFAAPRDKDVSERWIKDWLAMHGDNPGYDAVMAVVADGKWSDADGESYGRLEDGWGDGQTIYFNGTDAHGEIPNEFWDHAEIVLGRKLTDRASYFTCSC